MKLLYQNTLILPHKKYPLVNVRLSFSLLFGVLLILIPLLFSSTVSFFLIYNLDFFESLPISGWIIIFSISVVTMAFAFTPTTYVAMLGGYFLGMASAFYIIPAYLLASLLGYLTGRFIDHGLLLSLFAKREKVAIFIENLKRREFSFIVLSRLSPVLPFAFMNFLLSGLQVSIKNFLTAGFIGMLPRTILFIWLGSQAQDYTRIFSASGEIGTVRILTIALVVVSISGMIWLFKKSLEAAK